MDLVVYHILAMLGKIDIPVRVRLRGWELSSLFAEGGALRAGTWRAIAYLTGGMSSQGRGAWCCVLQWEAGSAG